MLWHNKLVNTIISDQSTITKLVKIPDEECCSTTAHCPRHHCVLGHLEGQASNTLAQKEDIQGCLYSACTKRPHHQAAVAAAETRKVGQRTSKNVRVPHTWRGLIVGQQWQQWQRWKHKKVEKGHPRTSMFHMHKEASLSDSGGGDGGGSRNTKKSMHLLPCFVPIWHLVHAFGGLACCQIRRGLRPNLWCGLQRCQWHYQLVWEDHPYQSTYHEFCQP